MKPVQLRGHCQVCCRNHAVSRSGLVAKHGYSVENGWFEGVCFGSDESPVEHRVNLANNAIAQIEADIVEMQSRHDDYKSGARHPEFVDDYRGIKKLSWDESSDYDKRRGVELAVQRLYYRIKRANHVIDMLKANIENHHGKELEVHAKPEGPAPIYVGEKRKLKNGRIASVQSVQGPRVYFKDERGFNSWSGSRAWRSLEIVE